jgi:hypothetical protein
MAAGGLALTLVGCSGASDFSASKLLPKADSFVPQSLSVSAAPPSFKLRAVTAADLVDQQGRCAAGGPATAGAAAEGEGSALVSGGIALAMTECEVVRRAGAPDQIEVGTSERGERALTLTYGRGPHPGIYHFVAGRLSLLERGPEVPAPPIQAKPKKPAPKTPAPG